MKQVRVRLFAAFRDLVGEESLDIHTASSSARELYRELCARVPGLHHEPQALVAINNKMTGWDTVIEDGDEVLLFPPVAGG